MIGAASQVTNCGEPTLFASMSTTTNDEGQRREQASEGRPAPHGPDAEEQRRSRTPTRHAPAS